MKILFLVFISVNVFGQGVVPASQKIIVDTGIFDLNDWDFFRVLVSGKPNDQFALKKQFRKLYAPYSKYVANQRKTSIMMNVIPEMGEGYELEIRNDILVLQGGNSGVFYGLKTLEQLAFQSNGKLQCQTIIDSPTYKWRGMHLDVSRHFFDVEFIKKYIDILALHKMNTFHWHLTDDQGWRIEIKKILN